MNDGAALIDVVPLMIIMCAKCSCGSRNAGDLFRRRRGPSISDAGLPCRQAAAADVISLCAAVSTGVNRGLNESIAFVVS